MKKYNKALAAYRKLLQESPRLSVDYTQLQIPDEQKDALVKLKDDFQVTTIATGETDFEKILMLMDYIHRELFFVGDNITPAADNTYEIMKVRKTGALFCSFHATVLCEMLLSIGIKAVKITCMPKNADGDQHIAALAYIRELKKWVFFDPTFNTYFFDNDETPLSICEIRERYRNAQEIKFKHIAINKQWALMMAGLECKTYDDWYQIYMAKNCFQFEFPTT